MAAGLFNFRQTGSETVCPCSVVAFLLITCPSFLQSLGFINVFSH
jgi:hypothetical protein